MKPKKSLAAGPPAKAPQYHLPELRGKQSSQRKTFTRLGNSDGDEKNSLSFPIILSIPFFPFKIRCSSLPTNLPRSKTGSSTCNSQPVTNPQHPVFLNSTLVTFAPFCGYIIIQYSFFIIQFLQSLPRLFRLRTCGVSPDCQV